MAIFKKKEKNTKAEVKQEEKTINGLTEEEIEKYAEEGMIQQSSSISQILDPNNTEPIVLFSEEGFKVTFEQVALIPYDNNLYVILKPIDKMVGVEEGEAIVFRVDYNEEELDYYLNIETNQDIINETFKTYSKLFEDEEKKFAKKVKESK